MTDLNKPAIFLSLAASLAAPLALFGQPSDQTPPNVLFIAIDDLNSCLEGLKGETAIPTPNINRLSSQGVSFTNAYCAAPGFNPSRAVLW